MQNGYLETRLLLQQEERATALFTLSKTIALGCKKALKELNVRVPDDISKIAIKFLFSRINNSEVKINQILLKPEMKFRKSVKRIG